MIRSLALGLLLALAGCNRHGAADVTLDADAAQRNATAAKTAADLAAADAASVGPAPATRDAPTTAASAPTPDRAPVEDADEPADETAGDLSNE